MYSIEQCVFMVLEYHRLECSPTATRRSFQRRFNVPKGPDAKSICKVFAKFERTGSVDDNRVGNVCPRQTVVTPENFSKVSGIVHQNSRNTVRRIASKTGLKRSSTQKILRDILRMFPYKIQCHQAIPIKAVRQRFDFVSEIPTMNDNEGFDVSCIWFTDEAHFHMNGFVNKQNWRFWGYQNPHLCEEKPLHSPKVTVWVAVRRRGIISPFFMRETISSERYIRILEHFVSTRCRNDQESSGSGKMGLDHIVQKRCFAFLMNTSGIDNPFPIFTGPLQENSILSEADRLFQGILGGPKSIVFHEDYLYTGLEDGRIVKIKDGKITTVARTGTACVIPYEERKCGRPSGLRKGKDGLLYFCDAYYGIFAMNFTTGALRNILPSNVHVEGQEIKLPDDLDIDALGNIYFTDASTKWDLSTVFNLIFENEAGGRVILYNIHSGEIEVLAKNLNFPSGVQLSKDGKSLLVCEFMNRRILRLQIKGEKKGKLEVFANALPAEPQNIRPSTRGGYWVGFTSARNSTNPLLIDRVSEYCNLKRFIGRIYTFFSNLLVKLSELGDNHAFKVFVYKLNRGDYIFSLFHRHGIVIEFDENGQILRSFHSPDGKISVLHEVNEHEGYIYLGSFINPYLGRLRLQ
ncbi:Adipocyte plasma membrane-associated protein [Araneus ventricosus]|uniref:Adipocyte plasma membrane-associated protein n=1 Tax=Araneus ventricosus TaxID=182803 RepID=A0A4Y2DG44_ARAVE|nr:Adipocyte plasma membrane-associated protein [Araneus ventricosus]